MKINRPGRTGDAYKSEYDEYKSKCKSDFLTIEHFL